MTTTTTATTTSTTPSTSFPAFEAALAAGDSETLLKLYTLEHTWRTRAEAQVQALLYSNHHGVSSRAATPGFLAGNTTPTEPKPKPKPKPISTRRSDDDTV